MFLEDHLLPAGTGVVIIPSMVHRDPRYWDDPEVRVRKAQTPKLAHLLVLLFCNSSNQLKKLRGLLQKFSQTRFW